jgi:hypothetical protein
MAVPRVELSSQPGAMTPAGFTLTVAADDGSPIDPDRAAGISVFHTQDPTAPAANWMLLDQPLVADGEALTVTDPEVSGTPRRFYRAEENP